MDSELKRELQRIAIRMQELVGYVDGLQASVTMEVENQTVDLVEGDNTITTTSITKPIRFIGVIYQNEQIAANITINGFDVVVNVGGAFPAADVNIIAFD